MGTAQLRKQKKTTILIEVVGQIEYGEFPLTLGMFCDGTHLTNTNGLHIQQSSSLLPLFRVVRKTFSLTLK